MDSNSNPAPPTQPVNPAQPVSPNPAPINPTPNPSGPVPTPLLQPMAPQPSTPPQMPQLQPAPRSKRPFVFVALALVLAAAAAGAFWWFTRPSAKSDADATKKAVAKSTGDTKAAPLTSLAKFSLVPPADLGGMKPFDLGVPGVSDYRSGNADNGCELQFGIFSATQVAGTDLSDIVSHQLAAVREAGGTITGPTSAPALIMKDDSGRKSYSLPSLSFSINVKNNKAVSHYSAGVLPDGRRVAVTRVCAALTGHPAPAESSLKPVDDVASRITIKTQ